MIIEIDFNSDEALYMQLRNQIIMGIATSQFHEGDSLPSVRQLADTAFFQGLKQGFNPLIIFHIPFFPPHAANAAYALPSCLFYAHCCSFTHRTRPGSKLPGLCSVVWFYFIMLPLVFMLFSA